MEAYFSVQVLLYLVFTNTLTLINYLLEINELFGTFWGQAIDFKENDGGMLMI